MGIERRQKRAKALPLRELLSNTLGATVVEYALIAGAVVLMIVGPIGLIRYSLKGAFSGVNSGLANSSSSLQRHADFHQISSQQRLPPILSELTDP